MRATLAVVMVVVVGVAWIVSKRKKTVDAVSIPEALHALTHGDDLRRQLAALALCSILFGEVTVLEELLDEVERKHEEYGKSRDDKRTLLDVAIEDAVVHGSQPAAMLLLAVTERDERWDDDDEWNTLVKGTIELLSSSTNKILTSRRDEPQIAALAARIDGLDAKTPPGYSLHDENAPRLYTVPDVLPFNTRVMCAECGTSLIQQQKEHIRCKSCNNVVYCCEDHARIDARRHAFWCSESY